VQFTPQNKSDLRIAALYDQWGTKAHERFYSFAALTHEPTAEISHAGHDRLIVALQENNLDVWLDPERYGPKAMEVVLDNPAQHIYEHALAGGES
jgi:putative SOS response-associated peptidase YedK